MKYILITTLLLLLPNIVGATTYEEMNRQIEAFEKSGQAKLAPASMLRVKAFQGASMLAAEDESEFNKTEEQSDALKKAVTKTLQNLTTAKNNALTFMNTFPELLSLEQEATKALVYHHKPQVLAKEAVQNLYNLAEEQMNITIVSTEKGDLNQARQAASKAHELYNACIDTAIPPLVKQTERALSHASSVGAKKYAPRTYAKAKQALEKLSLYGKDLKRKPEKRQGVQRPKRVGYALEVAIYAQKIAVRVKEWKRDNDSFEKLILDTQQNRLVLARTIGIPLDYEKVGVDISPEELLKHVKQMKLALDKERQMYSKDVSSLNTRFESELKKRLHNQRLQDQKTFQSKVANIKAAFSSKLERETFEKKRQNKVRRLFKKNEVQIITNLDGSLIIRAKKIKFGSNSSKVDGQYFDFLGRIKEALALYPSRKIIIEGHTDSSGDAKANRKLSLARAEAVQEFLIAAGMDASRIKALGYGEVKPIATNMYKKGRAMNRRIDILIKAP